MSLKNYNFGLYNIIFFLTTLCFFSVRAVLVSSGSCDHVLTQIDVPAVLTASGIYCLAQSLDGQGDVTIDVRGNDIILDLNGKVVRGGSTNINVANADDVTIKNGFIEGATQTNVQITNGRNIILSDIDIVQSVTGIVVFTSTQVTLDSINFRSHSAEVIVFNGVTAADLNNIRMKFNTHENTVVLQNSSSLTLDNVEVSEKNVSTNGSVATAAFRGINLSRCSFNLCKANDNVSTGMGGSAGFVFDSCQDIKCTNCLSSGNTSDGDTFGFRFGDPGSSSVKFVNCTANNNESTGGDCYGFSINGQDSLVNFCFALDNVATVTCAGIRIEPTAARASVLSSILKSNTGTAGSFGVLNNSISSSIYLNIAQGNATANYLGPAPTVAYTTATGIFGATPTTYDNVSA